MSVLLDYPDYETLMMGMARIVAKQLTVALADNGKAVLAVPGGITPAPFLERLSLMELDWKNVTILLTDERLQPIDPFRLNYRMVDHYLSQNASSVAQILPLAGADQPPDESLKAATTLYKPYLLIDVLVVGMGIDMHTASLFPDAVELKAALSADAPPLMVINSPSQPEQRITLTAPVLSGAKNSHVLIAGPEKLASFIEAEEGGGPVEEAPIRCVLQAKNMALVHHTMGV